MSDAGCLYQTFSYLLYTIAEENEEDSGETAFATIVEKNSARIGYSRHYRQQPNNKCLKENDWDSVCCAQLSEEEKWRFRCVEAHRQIA